MLYFLYNRAANFLYDRAGTVEGIFIYLKRMVFHRWHPLFFCYIWVTCTHMPLHSSPFPMPLINRGRLSSVLADHQELTAEHQRLVERHDQLMKDSKDTQERLTKK